VRNEPFVGPAARPWVLSTTAFPVKPTCMQLRSTRPMPCNRPGMSSSPSAWHGRTCMIHCHVSTARRAAARRPTEPDRH